MLFVRALRVSRTFDRALRVCLPSTGRGIVGLTARSISLLSSATALGTFFYCTGPVDSLPLYSSEWYPDSNTTEDSGMGWKRWWTDQNNYPWEYPSDTPLRINGHTEKRDLRSVHNMSLFERGCRPPNEWKDDQFAKKWARDNSTNYPYEIDHYPYNFDDLGNNCRSRSLAPSLPHSLSHWLRPGLALALLIDLTFTPRTRLCHRQFVDGYIGGYHVRRLAVASNARYRCHWG